MKTQPSTSPEQPETLSAVQDIIHLSPDEIKLDKKYMPKRLAVESNGENEKILQLARSILREGQENPCMVMESRPGVYSLLAGSRRRRAAIAINDGQLKAMYDPKKEGPFLLECKVRDFPTSQEAKRAAMAENVHREGFSQIELLENIKDVRKENGWEDGKFTKDVADYFGLSTATITETEKLDALPKPVKDQIHRGDIKGDAALLLVKEVREQERGGVLADAKELAKAEETAKAKKREEKAESGQRRMTKKEKADQEKKLANPVVKKKHVAKAAAKKKALKEGAKIAKTRKEILEFFDGLIGPATPPKMADFCKYFVEKYAAGTGTEGTAQAKWDAIADALPRSEQGKTTAPPDKKDKAAA